jgi:hypothetical protein
MDGLEESIRRSLERDLQSGVLRSAPSWGKPLEINDGFLETPEALRLGYKILKDAGYLPAEVEAFRALAALREELASMRRLAVPPEDIRTLEERIALLEQHLALVRERHRSA